MDKGSDLQKICCKLIDGTATQQEVCNQLAKYQNPDGGFAKGIEIEYLGDASSVMSIAAALSHIARMGLGDSKVYRDTVSYLKKVQCLDGSFDESDAFQKLPHPPYMDQGVYVEYKTGVIVKWLLAMGCQEKELINKAISYMDKAFDEVSKENDIWSAIGYIGVYAQLPPSPKHEEIMGWCMKVFSSGEKTSMWQQYSGRIESGEPISQHEVKAVLEAIKANQQADGAWQQNFGEYNRVWLAVYILQFIKQHMPKEIE